MGKEDVRYTHTRTNTHTMEYYSVIKKSEIMPFAATWMDLEVIILSEVNQKEKDKSHLYEILRFVKIRDRRLNSSCWGAGGVVWMRSYLIGTEF